MLSTAEEELYSHGGKWTADHAYPWTIRASNFDGEDWVHADEYREQAERIAEVANELWNAGMKVQAWHLLYGQEESERQDG